jgi:hypothetical protein
MAARAVEVVLADELGMAGQVVGRSCAQRSISSTGGTSRSRSTWANRSNS